MLFLCHCKVPQTSSNYYITGQMYLLKLEYYYKLFLRQIDCIVNDGKTVFRTTINFFLCFIKILRV